ncbi:MAG TPA: hypothetical protein VGS21_10875 [Acidimicrobiales bacterium]|nr:hypothetical protein [Acidimicrobiales bacterium]
MSPELLDAETANAVASCFGLGPSDGQAIWVARGAMADIYRLDAGGGRYAVRELFDWNPGDGSEDEAAFTARV